MAHIVKSISEYDKKRWKVTLDEGAVTFLLYKGEKRLLGDAGNAASAGTENSFGACGVEISDETYRHILEEVLLPRAKKRVLYYLKNADKTEFQIRRKLAEGFYPEEVIEKVMEFLHRYEFADDARYAESFIEAKKDGCSRRELEAKLYQKGIRGETVKEMLSGISAEDEYSACEKALRKKYTGDERKDFAYLARKGYPFDAIEHAINVLREEQGNGREKTADTI